MCDQTLPYNAGTLVWMKVSNRIWWPGKVVDPTTAPKELQDYMHKKKNAIAMIHFERDNKYDIVFNMDKVFLYNCAKKMEFLEKGYSLYNKQKKESKTQNFDMNYFLEDVINFEDKINGNVNIFQQFDEKKNEIMPRRRELIKELFKSAKDLKKSELQKKKQFNRKASAKVNKKSSLEVPPKVQIKQNQKALTTSTVTSASTSISTPMTPIIDRAKQPVTSTPILASTSTSPSTSITPIHEQAKLPVTSTVTSGKPFSNYNCYLTAGCKFVTNYYPALKRHMAECKLSKDEVNVPNKKQPVSKALFKTTKKRKAATNKKQSKKNKIPEELLKDWDDDVDDQDDNTAITGKEKTNLKSIFDIDDLIEHGENGTGENGTAETESTNEQAYNQRKL